jgi:leucyl aminopeptidase (aminopeptidase T)
MMRKYDDEIVKAINNVYDNCICVKWSEKVLVVSDDGTVDTALPFWSIGLEKVKEAYFVVIRKREISGEEPPEEISYVMSKSDICLLITSKSLSHTNASRNAAMNGARIASMPGITDETIKRTLTADYRNVKAKTDSVVKSLENVKDVTITNKDGTILTFSVEGRKFGADTGIIKEPGQFANLPAGEVCTAPVEGTANGILIVDGAVPTTTILDKPITMEFKDGRLVRLEGGTAADDLKRMLDKYGSSERNLAELGIGTNEKAKLIPNILESEKVIGTFHIAIGDNKGMGGNVEANIHLDFVVRGAKLEIDGRTIIDDGKLLI